MNVIIATENSAYSIFLSFWPLSKFSHRQNMF